MYEIITETLWDRPLVIAATITALLVLYQLGVYAYNFWFHPLRNYPGPTSTSISQIPMAWFMIRGDAKTWITDLHTRYGHVVRVCPNELSYANSQAFKDIYGHRKAGQQNPTKDPRLYINSTNVADKVNKTGNSIISANDADHSRMRRIFSHAFSDKAMKLQEPLFMTYVDKLIAKLHFRIKSDSDQHVDMVQMYNFTTFDVMGDLTFAEPLHLLEGSSYSPWVAQIFNSLHLMCIQKALRYYPLVEKAFDLFVPKSVTKAREAHMQYSADRVNRRLEKGTTKPDIWNLVLKQEDSKSLSLKEMHTNAGNFMTAGTETTATLLSGLTYYLLKNPDRLEKLTQEIRTEFSSDEDISMEKIAQLKYLHACVEEGLRMYPPVPFGLPRITPNTGVEICGQYVPPKTCVSVSHYATFHHPQNFKDPYSFIPERWIDEDFESDDKSALQPFSVGARNCIGKNMAYHEMRLILSKILWHFDLNLCQESERWDDQKVWMFWSKGPLMCTLTPVKR